MSMRSLKNEISRTRPFQSPKSGRFMPPFDRLKTAQTVTIAQKTVPPATA